MHGYPTRPDVLNQSSLELLTTPSSANKYYALGIGIWKEMSLWYNNGNEDYTKPAVNDPFTYGVQDMLLEIVGNPERGYQSIDQFK